jgi:ATP-dependent helicase HrpB
VIPLPIDPHVPVIEQAVRAARAVVIEASPGSGKTTRIPPALLDVVEGAVWVLEPRRVAARAAASRVAEERGWRVGDEVGWLMRLDRRLGPATRLIFATEAVLTRRIAAEPDLPGIGAVVLDEFHERSVHTDAALARLAWLRRRGGGPALIVMSATLDGASLARFLDCPHVRVDGSLYPVELRHAPGASDTPPELRAARIARELAGDTLVFLPGKAEIRRCAEAIGAVDADVIELHAEVDDQDRALRSGPRRRIVLATNVAETSLTLEGIAVVIDTGLHRVPTVDPWTGIPALELRPIPRNSAAQRAGRAGRLGPGVCIRLYEQADHDARPAALPPEVARADLAGTALDLAGVELAWFEPPPAGSWRAARTLLERLGAIDVRGRTPIGDAMAALPLAPRLARMVVEGAALGVGDEACRMATLFARPGRVLVDPVAAVLDGAGERQEARLLARLLPTRPRARDGAEALTLALLAGFPDRVGQRLGDRVVLSEGGSAACPPGPDGWVVVADAGRVGTRLLARMASPVPEGWLLDRAAVATELRWAGTRVEVAEELRFGALVLESGPGTGDAEAVSSLLFEHALPVAHRVFADHDRAASLVRRAAWIGGPGFDLTDLVREACAGRRSLDQLGEVSLVSLGKARLPGIDLDRLAPEHVALPGRPKAPVRWDGDAPYVESRLQDFFGLAEAPRVGGRPLLCHLLAPNHRPVQITSDLGGFWTRHYPGIRRELMRRYPRHAWPEEPG